MRLCIENESSVPPEDVVKGKSPDSQSADSHDKGAAAAPLILLVEDNSGDVFLIRLALEESGIEHELHVVRDGEQAIDFVSRIGQPGGVPCLDLVLLDLNLPKIEGPQVLIQLRSNPAHSFTPVIVVSSSDAESDRARFAGLLITRYFRKPNDLGEFMQLGALVREVLESKRP
jgi:CheY-like chemotaxis protein